MLGPFSSWSRFGLRPHNCRISIGGFMPQAKFPKARRFITKKLSVRLMLWY
jgi:hypothetical protein